MSRNPDDLVRLSEAEADRLARLYMEAEREILLQVDRAMARGNDLRYLRSMLENVQVILEDLLTGNRQWCEQAIPRVYIEGAKYADDMAGKAIAGFGAVHQQAVKVLADNTFDRLESVRQVIGRRTEDMYRQYALEATRQSIIGYKSWQQVSRDFRDNLRTEGITGFRDAAGRDWNMKTYAEMVARTTTAEAHWEGTGNRLLEHGIDLVIISSHAGACELCQPWQDRVVSLTGKTPGYPTMQEAIDAGFRHPNCRHSFSGYVDLDAEIEALERELDDNSRIDDSEQLTVGSSGGIPKVSSFTPLGGGVSDTFTGTMGGKKHVFKADEIPSGLSMTRSNLEAELLAEKVLNHLGVSTPKADYREFDVDGGRKQTMLRVEFVQGGALPDDFMQSNANWSTVLDKPLFRKMQVIDVLIGNGDRHGRNFFVMPNGQVVPIDHNLAFATDLVIDPGVSWQKNFLSNVTGANNADWIVNRNDMGREVRRGTTSAEYARIASDVQRTLTDSDVASMVDALPSQLADDMRKRELKRILTIRRDNLVDMMNALKGVKP